LDQLEVQRLHNRIAELPAYNGSDTATAQHHNYNNTNDDGGVVLLWCFGTNRHIIHDFFSPYEN
jgi:hypothetical protein